MIFIKNLDPVYKAIKKVRKNLDKEKSLISFVGAPWTLITYMFSLKKKRKYKNLLKDKKREKIIIENLNKYLMFAYKKSN